MPKTSKFACQCIFLTIPILVITKLLFFKNYVIFYTILVAYFIPLWYNVYIR
jgi:hypothetical protein